MHVLWRELIMGKWRSLFLAVVLSLKLMVAILLMLFVVACHTGTSLSTDSSPAAQEIKQQENPYAKADITTKIIPSANNTFGYDILLYGKPLVHQPSMPGLPGNEGFTTQERAQTVADFVVKKIRNNEMPPTVTMEDLNTMGVLK
jgi:hypothetical protein